MVANVRIIGTTSQALEGRAQGGLFNIELLEKSLLEMVWSGRITQGEGALVTNARHKELLDKVLSSMVSAGNLIKTKAHPELIAVDLKEAIFDLGLIVGRSVSDEVLNRIFENFCIGK